VPVPPSGCATGWRYGDCRRIGPCRRGAAAAGGHAAAPAGATTTRGRLDEISGPGVSGGKRFGFTVSAKWDTLEY
jgi:hypothetical protein